MKDVQSLPDTRGIPLNRAGISGARLPIVVNDQPTVGTLEIAVSLPAAHKGRTYESFFAGFPSSSGEAFPYKKFLFCSLRFNPRWTQRAHIFDWIFPIS